ncbi:hypothetical protein ACNAR2_28490 [Klebsiella pneumoniae]|uniref:hypothetical protein n=1 Tax=Klebsiella pneumoniae TaxID=573 RepID=UPI0028A3E015|nr:hypothetical protein [Klebsiella pneumoniae]HDZ0926505.1 hypothetical protein [Klebsiella pneumoniae]HDZ0957712.1 hypothetical protein [Klebsiella pneumoniae]
MNIETVNELIQSLESAGELSIKEQKYLELARAFKQLAAENVGLKAAFEQPQAYLSWHAIPPTWNDPLPCGEYLDVHDTDGHKNSDGTDCWPVYAKPEIETPATDRIVAGIKADGVEEFAAKLRIPGDDQFFDALAKGVALAADDFAKQLREGADK